MQDFQKALLAGGVLGAGFVGPWFVLGQQVLLPELVPWPVALAFGSFVAGLGGYLGLRATLNPGTHEGLQRRGTLVGIFLPIVTLALVSIWLGLTQRVSTVAVAVATGTGIGLTVSAVYWLWRASGSLYDRQVGRETQIDLPKTVQQRRLRRFRLVALLPLGIALVFSGFVWITTQAWFPLYMTGMLSVMVIPTTDREMSVTDAGLQIGIAVWPWACFEAFRFEDDRLILARRGWVRWTHEFPREEIDDEQQLREVLSSVLDEQSS